MTTDRLAALLEPLGDLDFVTGTEVVECLAAAGVTVAATLPPQTRLVLMADNLLEQIGTRTDDGYRITAEWGEQRPEGWYEPVFTVHYDEPFPQPAPDALRDELGCNPDCIWKSSHLYACGTRIANLEAQLAQLAADALRVAYRDDPVGTFNAIVAVLNEHGWDARPVAPDKVPTVRESSARLGITMTEHNAPDIVHPAPFEDDYAPEIEFNIASVTTPDGQVYQAHVPCCWCGEHHEEGN